MIRVAKILGILFLTACSTGETSRLDTSGSDLPPMQTFTEARVAPPVAPNSVIARDFLDLAFRLENGTRLTAFSRFEGPITVRVVGRAPSTLDRDLDRLLVRLRSEADLDIQKVGSRSSASITVQAVPIADLQRVAPSAACFVRPNVSDWSDYRARRNSPDTLWSGLNERKRMAIFLPNDVSPQEVRDCLHEEIAQALGPVNDLFRLTNSIFNDDNFHSVLTGYDMLILRTHYDAGLQNGMSPDEVARRLPAILARLNPRGGRAGIAPPKTVSSEWLRSITSAMDKRTSKPRRRSAAERAVSLAAVNGAPASQLALSYYWLGRVSIGTDPEKALNAFLSARALYRQSPRTETQGAQVALQLAAFQLSVGQPGTAIRLVDESLPATRRAENAVLLSLLLFVKAEALTIQGNDDAAASTQREALSWARYGFGSDAEVRERAAEILAISPRTRNAARNTAQNSETAT
jgi:hypothetical protein